MENKFCTSTKLINFSLNPKSWIPYPAPNPFDFQGFCGMVHVS